MMQKSYAWRRRVGLILVVGLAVGCGGGVGGSKEWSRTELEDHLSRIASLYQAYRNANKGKTPKDTAELKAWVKKLKKSELESRKIDDVDKAFISPRDGQEYVIVPTPKNAMMGMSKVIAYERVGKGGKRMKVGSQGHSNEVTEEELDKLLEEIGQKRI